jgi:hypothetical protein
MQLLSYTFPTLKCTAPLLARVRAIAVSYKEVTTPPKLLLKASIVSEMAVNLGSIRRSPVMQDEQFYD